ncbi:MAG: DNA polymerase III subunit alpha [bacterium]|nr:DNA polymerase III subunit alpha [bacterium]
MSFVHLHNHSHYSLLDGLSKIDGMVKKAKSLGMSAVAITDHGNMYGAIEFYKECKKQGIKPIIGVEAYIANRSRFDKQPGVDNERYHMILLAKNNNGYKNLIKLVTAANLEGYYYKPRMDKELLRKYGSDIIALSGCLGGEFSKAIWNRDFDKAEAVALEYQEIFGKENYFIEIQSHSKLERFDEITEGQISVARKLGIPLVATQDSHYLNHDDNKAHDTLVAIQTNTDLTDADRLTNAVDDFSFFSPDEAREKFKNTPDAIENTLKIAEMCNIDIKLGSWVFPDIKVPGGRTYDEELRRLTYEGIPKRGLTESKDVIDRIEYELKIIFDKGYSPYFLVVSDLLDFSHKNGILTNIRGSVAGSIVTYLTHITNVNPLEYKLPFERFLNPERPSAPDIDMDFSDNRRAEVIQYAKDKYGADKVAQIGTFGSMMARGSVKDVSRALAHPYEVGERLSKLIPMGSQGFPMTIKSAMEMVPELQEAYDKEPQTKEIIDLAMKLEGCVRHCSVHAAGVVISPEPLNEVVPLQYEPRGEKIITQYDMHAVEDIGLLKFDFLGIKNLSILGDAMKIAKETTGIDIDIENIPIDDKKTYEMLARGETMGLFQLNGSGMTKYLKELRPTVIHDINAMVALYRPGPIEMIPEYIARKHDPRKITFLDPRMKEILSASYGVITYQDDVMLIAIHLAGYSWLEADKLRKAMGKKIPAEMEAQKSKLLEGFVKHGMKTEKANELWLLIEPFAAYGFNKAHAASYGRVAYQTAYMKANFPVEYMTAVLTADAGDVEEISAIVAECKRMGIPILPPDVNQSNGSFTAIKEDAGDKIRFGLYAIKNLGEEISNVIIAERKRGGRFNSFSSFLERVKHKNLNKKSLEALIKAGAFDEMGERGQMIYNMEDVLNYIRENAKAYAAQSSLFGGMANKASVPDLKLKPAPVASVFDKLNWEKELLGLYLSGHPLDKYKDKLDKNTIKHTKTLGNGATVVIGGIVESVRQISTKKNELMAFVKIADFTDSMEVVVFPRTFTQYKNLLVPEKCLAIRGTVSIRNDEPSMIAEAIKDLDEPAKS